MGPVEKGGPDQGQDQGRAQTEAEQGKGTFLDPDLGEQGKHDQGDHDIDEKEHDHPMQAAGRLIGQGQKPQMRLFWCQQQAGEPGRQPDTDEREEQGQKQVAYRGLSVETGQEGEEGQGQQSEQPQVQQGGQPE